MSDDDDERDISALATPEPDPYDLDDVDRAVLAAIAAANATQAGRGNDEPGGYIYRKADGKLENPVSFGTPGSVQRGSVESNAGNWAVAGWHGHGPVPRSDPYYNPVNFNPSPGDRNFTFTIENQQLRALGRLGADQELREYLITPDGGVRRYDNPVAQPGVWRPIAASGFYTW
ncbi:MAG TPA: hypothetical protein VG889_19165 [Rhizomicrobium sp.]|nr:hypothetical protein [Rhizomicrobium sp.]